MNRLQISLLEEFNMLNFLSENLGTIVVAAILAGLAVLAILSLRKDSEELQYDAAVDVPTVPSPVIQIISGAKSYLLL